MSRFGSEHALPRHLHEAIAQGIRRLVSGDCACPEGAFYKGVLAQRARYKSLLAADAAL